MTKKITSKKTRNTRKFRIFRAATQHVFARFAVNRRNNFILPTFQHHMKSTVVMYSDGACSGNPGRGGFGTILIAGQHRKELSAGYRKTTNNRMELLGAISGLEALTRPCRVLLHTDSAYIVNAINKGWARRWREQGWMRNKKESAENPDLWERLLELLDTHDVEFIWVRGHAGNVENERADRLAVAASQASDLLVDAEYERRS